MPAYDWPSVRDILDGKHTGKEVELRGWIFRTRGSNKYVFAVVRDSTDIIQVTITKGEIPDAQFEVASKTQVEASVIVKGKVVADTRAPGGYELHATQFVVVGPSDKFPITKDRSEEHVRDIRHLWIRSRYMNALLRIRSTVTGAIHEFFRAEGYYEFTPPIFTPNACEGGSTLFEVKYYDKKVYMTQSWQLYAEAAVFTLEKIYDVSPTFRAEKSKTSRHLSEFWMAEMEAAWLTYRDVLKVAEREVKFIIKRVLENNRKELEILEANPARLEPMLTKEWPVITYTQALDMLREKANMDIEWGKDLRTNEEAELTKFFDTPVSVIQYPKEIMAFYKPVDPEAQSPEQVCKCFDMLAPEGYGEIIGGSERDTDIESLRNALLKQGENPENYEWYLDLRRYGSVPHSGYGLGVERLIAWICKIDNIKDAIPFPRTITRFTP